MIGSSSYLQGNYNISDEFEFRPDSTKDYGVSCPCASEKIPYTYNGSNVVSTLASSFLIGSSLFLHVTRTTVKAWMSSNFGGIPPWTAELVALGCVKNRCIILLAPSFLIGSSSFLQVRRTTIISRTSSNFDQILPRTTELAVLERLKKISKTYNGSNVVSSLWPLFLIGSSPVLKEMRTTIKAWMSSNFGGIPPRTAELAALECVKTLCITVLAL